MDILRKITDSLFGYVITKNHDWEYAGFWFVFPSFTAASRNLLYGIAPWWWRKRHYTGHHRKHYRRSWDSMPLRWELQERAYDNARLLGSLQLPGELITY